MALFKQGQGKLTKTQTAIVYGALGVFVLVQNFNSISNSVKSKLGPTLGPVIDVASDFFSETSNLLMNEGTELICAHIKDCPDPEAEPAFKPSGQQNFSFSIDTSSVEVSPVTVTHSMRLG